MGLRNDFSRTIIPLNDVIMGLRTSKANGRISIVAFPVIFRFARSGNWTLEVDSTQVFRLPETDCDDRTEYNCWTVEVFFDRRASFHRIRSAIRCKDNVLLLYKNQFPQFLSHRFHNIIAISWGRLSSLTTHSDNYYQNSDQRNDNINTMIQY